jgi:hypothetical protein
MPLLDDLGRYLTAQGVVSTGWKLCLSYLADEQDKVIGLFETGGYPAQELNRDNERVTFQVRVRGPRLDYTTAKNKWQVVFNALQDARETSGSPVLLPNFIYIQAMQYGPIAMTDNEGRPNLVSNFRVMRSLR